MASSKAKKKEKKKDFQKAKLKVGKAKPKAANHTDTSFKAKRITINQQSLGTDAPSYQAQFAHHVSLLSSASDVQRKESLSWLESALASRHLVFSSPDLLDRLLPLLQDANGGVRTKLVKVLQALPKENLEYLADKILLHIWAGMTNINVNIRASALDVLDWAIDVCSIELVQCRGGWYNTLKTYLVMLGWSTIGDVSTGWSSNMALSGDMKNIVKALDTLTNFLRLGMENKDIEEAKGHNDWWKLASRIHARPDPYRELHLYGRKQEEGNSYTRDASHRRELFLANFRSKFEEGIQEVRKQAGEAGRAAAKASNIIADAMKEADAAKILQDKWTRKMETRTSIARDKIWKYGFGNDTR